MYEKTNTGAVKKYYAAFGRTIAIRDVPTGSGAGTLYYPVPDHLGSTSTVLDASGNTVSSQRYWPYGATRSGSVPQTDRLYTGQRQEQGDAAMGLYNYKARFYSTTLGRFVSADPTGDSFNRYAYVDGNPIRYADPTGLALGLLCGWGQNCRSGNGGIPGGGSINQWRSTVIEYWNSPESRVHFGEADLGFVFNLFAGALSNPLYFQASDILEIFDVFVYDTSPDGAGPFRGVGGEINTTPVAMDFWRQAEGLDYPIHYYAGFSFGAMTLNEYLWLRHEDSTFADSVWGVYLYAGPDLGRTTAFSMGVYYHNATVVARSSRWWVPGAVSTGVSCHWKVICYPTFEWRDDQIDPHYSELTGGERLRSDDDATCGHHCLDVDLSRQDANEIFN